MGTSLIQTKPGQTRHSKLCEFCILTKLVILVKLVNLVILVHKYCGIYDNDNDNDNDNDANANDNDNDHDDDDNGLPGVRNGSPQTRAALGVPAIPANC